MKHIIFYSGGIGSWATAKRVASKHGLDDLILMFTDTLIEDKDLYRFLIETAQELYGLDYKDLIHRTELIPDVAHETMKARKEYLLNLAEDVRERIPQFVWIADGRDPWEVFKDVKWIGNSRIAQCSHKLKQDVAAQYLKKHYKPETPLYIKKIDYKKKEIIYWEDPEVIERLHKEWEDDERETCKMYLGIDWTEEHRKASPEFNWLPYKVEFPMCEEPFVVKDEMLTELNSIGIKTPLLYLKGFSHNNCGSFCVRAGQGHFINLLQQFPNLYKYHEEKEQEMRDFLGKDVAMLKRTRKKVQSTLTLKQLREEHEAKSTEIDMTDIGGCGCFVDVD
jgi:hypothetical protein